MNFFTTRLFSLLQKHISYPFFLSSSPLDRFWNGSSCTRKQIKIRDAERSLYHQIDGNSLMTQVVMIKRHHRTHTILGRKRSTIDSSSTVSVRGKRRYCRGRPHKTVSSSPRPEWKPGVAFLNRRRKSEPPFQLKGCPAEAPQNVGLENGNGAVDRNR